MKKVFVRSLMIFSMIGIFSATAQASVTEITNGVCVYTSNSGVKSACTDEQKSKALAKASRLGNIDPGLYQQPAPVYSAPSVGSFNWASFRSAYGF